MKLVGCVNMSCWDLVMLVRSTPCPGSWRGQLTEVIPLTLPDPAQLDTGELPSSVSQHKYGFLKQTFKIKKS